jgi:REP element-mobilizing transposase RayT
MLTLLSASALADVNPAKLTHDVGGADKLIIVVRLHGQQVTAAQRTYHKGVLWSPSYFAASCGGAPISIIRQYIEQQQTPD